MMNVLLHRQVRAGRSVVNGWECRPDNGAASLPLCHAPRLRVTEDPFHWLGCFSIRLGGSQIGWLASLGSMRAAADRAEHHFQAKARADDERWREHATSRGSRIAGRKTRCRTPEGPRDPPGAAQEGCA